MSVSVIFIEVILKCRKGAKEVVNVLTVPELILLIYPSICHLLTCCYAHPCSSNTFLNENTLFACIITHETCVTA